MFDNPGGKLKTLAWVGFFLGSFSSVCGGVYLGIVLAQVADALGRATAEAAVFGILVGLLVRVSS